MRTSMHLPGVVATATAVAVALVAATAGAAVALTGTGRTPGAQPGRDRAEVDNAALTSTADPGGTVVTLVTGDVVTVGAAGTKGSKCPQVSVVPAVKSSVVARTCGPDGHLRVIPSDAASLVGTVLDPALFDVTALIANGYDDAHSAQTPLIVQYADQDSVKKAASGAGPGRSDAGFGGRMQHRTALTSIRGVAGRQPKSDAAGLRATLPELSAKGSAAGVTKIMLDGKVVAAPVKATAAASSDMEQIGAPQAWQAGYTGKGVRIAVLDSGIDANHPDLAGQVVEAADFTGSGSTQDQVGHGTHVAGIIAGTGVASGGARKGVAPGAQLVVGRVVDGTKQGRESDVIAGMEWAASRAGIVNMSLGRPEQTDEPDPIADAVEQLTKQYGTLFVIAAGNTGPDDQSVGTPGTAPSALTVGSVDGTGTVAATSSRGPTTATGSLKPDLVAPGVGIVAARAKGADMATATIIDANYTANGGTSMAAPHVAGAAALLKQRHPDWTANQIKADLTGTANPAKGGDPYVTGAGVVDIAQALEGPVTTTSTVNLGTFAYPQTGSTNTELGYANPSDQAATLALTVTAADRNGHQLPVGAVTLSASTLELRVGGKASVVLKVNQTMLAGRSGYNTATVKAADQRGRVLTTLVAFRIEGPSSTLTLSTVQWPEASAVSASATVVNLDDPALFSRWISVPVGATTAMRVPNGRYSVIGTVIADSLGTGAGKAGASALVGDPDMVIANDTEVALDPTTAKEVTVAVEGVETRTDELGVAFMQTGARGVRWSSSIWESAASDRLFAAPMVAETGQFDTAVGAKLYQPGDQPSPFAYDLMFAGTSFPTDGRRVVSKTEQANLAQVHQRFRHLDLDGAVVSHTRKGMTPWGDVLTEMESTNLPETRIDYLTPGSWMDKAIIVGLVNGRSQMMEPQRTVLAGGRETKDWARQPLHSDWLDTLNGYVTCQEGPIARTSGNLNVTVTPLVDAHGRYGCWDKEIDNQHLALYRDGEKVGEANTWRGNFPMSQGAASYRLTFEESFAKPKPIATAVNTAWTFRSTGPSDGSSVPVALLSLDYDLGLTSTSRSGGGPATITVHQMSGTDPQQIKSAEVATSTNDGATWTPASVTLAPGTSTADGSFQATLPTSAPGATISLRVKVIGASGSEIEQTMIRAYRAA